ncbi:MAG: hypothetical protein PVH88_02145 [Ignavibacteria bacterium]|jgi:hypothetical protein
MLGKDFTLKETRNIILQWVKELDQVKIERKLVNKFINMAVTDTAEILGLAELEPYGETAILNNVNSSVNSYSEGVVTEATYSNTTKSIEKSPHSLTTNHIGRRIVFWSTTSNIAIGQIVSIPDENNFTVNIAVGSDMSSVNYSIFSEHSVDSLDISDLRINQTRKLTDSVNGLILPTTDTKFDNLSEFDEKSDNIYWYRHGEKLLLHKGANISGYGEITLHYFRYPYRATIDSDYLDIRDQFIPGLVIPKVKNYVLEHLGIEPSEKLIEQINSRTEKIRNLNIAEKASLNKKES